MSANLVLLSLRAGDVVASKEGGRVTFWQVTAVMPYLDLGLEANFLFRDVSDEGRERYPSDFDKEDIYRGNMVLVPRGELSPLLGG